jgi:hypothetical protein
MYTLLMIGSGIFWSVTYFLIIRRSILDQTYGMPLFALCANISWEFIFSFIYPPSIIQHVVNVVWFALDLVILIQFLRFGPREFADLPKCFFYIGLGLALITSFFAVFLITLEAHDRGGVYAAFGQNLMMSILFIAMLYHRRSLRGQSISIAVCKLIGTALASLAFSLFSRHSDLLLFFYIAIFVYDVLYVGMLVYMQQQVGTKAADEPKMVSSQMEGSIQSR